MRVDVIDMSDPKLGNHRKSMVAEYSECIIVMYPMSNGIVQMIDNVYNRVSASGDISILRIWGHGWAGGQLIAAGADMTSGVNNASALWGPNVNDYSDYLSKLSELFASDGHVELKGCSVGQGTAGEKFLVKLAVVLNVPVQAGSITQGGQDSSLSSFSGIGWDGWVVEATPDYVVKYVAGSAL
jgi:hypothetical protein